MILYDYFRSSAAYRVRLAIELKGLSVKRRPVHLLRNGGEQNLPEYLAKNPQALVPAFELDDGTVLTQSLAIIGYLEALQPLPRLFPAEPILAAKAMAVALTVACDIHPLNNLRVLTYLERELNQSESSIGAWRTHWILKGGLEAIEQSIEPGPFCFGATPTIADVCLIPQVYNARRCGSGLDHLAKIRAVEAACLALPAFRAAHPSAQADAE